MASFFSLKYKQLKTIFLVTLRSLRNYIKVANFAKDIRTGAASYYIYTNKRNRSNASYKLYPQASILTGISGSAKSTYTQALQLAKGKLCFFTPNLT